MGKRTTLLLAFALSLVSCTGESSDTPTTATSDAAPTTTSAPVQASGRLVILDGQGNVVVMGPDGSDPTNITDDAGASAAYTQPLWSPDGGSLAFGQFKNQGFAVGIHDLAGSRTTTIDTGNLPFYVSFSPRGDRLGVLHNGSVGIDFNIVDVGRGTIETVDTGAPFYFSWSPNSDLLVTHVGVDRVETIDPEGERTALEPTGPLYLAPQWVDRGVFHVVGDDLVLESESGSRAPLANVSALTMFVANPQGTLVAIQAVGDSDAIQAALADPPDISLNQVVVLDVTSGEVDTVSDELALGFFWSPDGEKLLTLVPGDPGVVPRVWETDGTSTDYQGYLPNGTMLQDTFPFFPQYAQSVSFWAPNSSAFAYAGEVDGETGIWVQTLHGEAPELVSAGRWVAWGEG